MKTNYTTEYPTKGLNLVIPPSELPPGKVQKSQNAYPEYGKLKKIGGTTRYNPELVGSASVTWIHRYYGRRDDGTQIKKLLFFSFGNIYIGNDANGATTMVKNEFVNKNTQPSHEIIQVSGNARMYFFNDGEDVPYYYEGDDGNNFYKSSITLKPVMGVSWLNRLWVFEKNSAIIAYSKDLNPENFTDSTDAGEIQIGVAKDEIIIGHIRYNDTLYIFTDKKIYYIEGRTPSTFSVRECHSSLGLESRLSLVNVEDAIIFMGTDKEIYSFRGSQASTRHITQELNFSNIVNPLKTKNIVCGYHNNLLRISYEPYSQESTTVYNSDEIICNIKDPGENGMPKWGHVRGSNVSCYTVWDRFGDRNELTTGRSDVGCVMYHNRTDNFDNKFIELDIKTRDIMFSPNINARIHSYYLNGKTNGYNTIRMSTYLDGRTDNYTTDNFSQEGEVRTLGAIRISQQIRFCERIKPALNLSRGQSVMIQLFDDQLNKKFELHSIAIGIKRREHKLNQKIGA